MSNGTLAEVAAWMKGQVGYHEGANNANKYSSCMGHPAESWCADFCNCGLKSNGVPLVSTSAYTPSLATSYQLAHRWGHTPRVGAMAFIFSVSEGRIVHTCWVRAVVGSSIYTVEGNYSNQVMRNVRPALRTLGHSGVIGYGYPAYRLAPVTPPTPSAPTPTGKMYLGRYLQSGSTGLAVSNLQKAMNVHLSRGYHLVVDGIFGPKTKSAVVQFQKDMHLSPDGIVGPNTARALGWVWVG